MENSKGQICTALPHFCSAGIQPPKIAVQPELKTEKPPVSEKMKGKKKPWSVFGDLYWI